MRKLAATGFGILLTLTTCGLTFAAEGGTQMTVTGNLRDSFCNTVMGAQGPAIRNARLDAPRPGFRC